jgi:hypothetical protein
MMRGSMVEALRHRDATDYPHCRNPFRHSLGPVDIASTSSASASTVDRCDVIHINHLTVRGWCLMVSIDPEEWVVKPFLAILLPLTALVFRWAAGWHASTNICLPTVAFETRISYA